jgi:hypothetical protein
VVKTYRTAFQDVAEVKIIDTSSRGFLHQKEGRFGYKYMCKFFSLDVYDYLREYGQVADPQGGMLPTTIPQTLVQMNGKLAREMVKANAATSTGRIAGMAADDRTRLELAFLVALTRRPTSEERESLLPLVTLAESKGRGLEDVMWALFNCPEFSWNH